MFVFASFDEIMNCSAACILSGWYVSDVCAGDAYQFDCGLQRHLLELRLPRGSKDAPDTFIALIIATIKLLSGELLTLLSQTKRIIRNLI